MAWIQSGESEVRSSFLVFLRHEIISVSFLLLWIEGGLGLREQMRFEFMKKKKSMRTGMVIMMNLKKANKRETACGVMDDEFLGR